MSALLAGLSLGASALSGISGRREAKKYDAKSEGSEQRQAQMFDKGQASLDEALKQQQGIFDEQRAMFDDYEGKQQANLDLMKPMIDQFSKAGTDSYDKYQAMLGPIEQVVGDTIMNRDAGDYSNVQNTALQQEFDKAMLDQQDYEAQNNIVSGQQGTGANAVDLAQQKAVNRMAAEDTVLGQQSQFMNYASGKEQQSQNFMTQGLGMQQNQNNAQNNLYSQAQNNLAGLYGNQANMYGNYANSSANMYGQQAGMYGNQANQYANQSQGAQQQGQQGMTRGLMAGGYFGDQAGWFDGLKGGGASVPNVKPTPKTTPTFALS